MHKYAHSEHISYCRIAKIELSQKNCEQECFFISFKCTISRTKPTKLWFSSRFVYHIHIFQWIFCLFSLRWSILKRFEESSIFNCNKFSSQRFTTFCVSAQLRIGDKFIRKISTRETCSLNSPSIYHQLNKNW